MNKGFENEMNIVRACHGKKISVLTPHWRKCVLTMFPEACGEDEVRCHQLRKSCKTDVEFTACGRTVNVSIKQGHSNTMHGESIWSFVRFLRSIGVSKKTVAVFLYYQFGDGTIKGDGNVRFTVDDMRAAHEEEFNKANAEFQKTDIVAKVIYRAIVHGTVKQYKDIDFFYYGNEKFGYLAPIEKVMVYLLDKKVERVSTLSFGPLSYQPYSRNLDQDPKDERKRFIVQIKWPQMADDMKLICSAAK